MKHLITLLLFIVIIFGLVLFLKPGYFSLEILKNTMEKQVPAQSLNSLSPKIDNPLTPEIPAKNNKPLQAPLDQASVRISKKSFGQFITPQTSPVQPERFSGYHTGVDFEIFPKELTAEVPVRAVCTGPLKVKQQAQGYGGIVVQNCELESEPITVIYGHLKLSSVNKKATEQLAAGEIIGILGAYNSAETDGERKHLHLGIHRGPEINILGYVATTAELRDWIDPCLYVCD